MPLYRPIRTTSSAVPDALSTMRGEIASLSAATAGQLNGTIRKLKAMIATIPLVHAHTYSASGWTVSPETTRILSASLPVRAGQTDLAVLVMVTAKMANAGTGENSKIFNIPTYALSVAGQSIPLVMHSESTTSSDYSRITKQSTGWAIGSFPTSGATAVPFVVSTSGDIPNQITAEASIRLGVISISSLTA